MVLKNFETWLWNLHVDVVVPGKKVLHVASHEPDLVVAENGFGFKLNGGFAL